MLLSFNFFNSAMLCVFQLVDMQMHCFRQKERVPISVLLDDPPKYTPDCDHLSDASLDLSMKSSNASKDMLDFCKKKGSNSGSGGMRHYPPSDSESNASPVPSSHRCIQSALYPPRHQLHYQFPLPVQVHHPHHHPHPTLPTRYPTPRYPVHHLPSSPSGESIVLPDTRSYCFEPPYSPPQVISQCVIYF